MTISEQVAGAVDILSRGIQESADIIAAQNGINNAEALSLVWRGLLDIYGTASVVETDARTAKWRIRIRLYDMRQPNEPQADTDPELPADAVGTTVLRGLPAVADEVISLANIFHNSPKPLMGMNTEELDRRLRGLRPTLSRRGGNAVWRIPYDTFETWGPGEAHKAAWLARVDVERVTQ
jgi:hypothetical protein